MASNMVSNVATPHEQAVKAVAEYLARHAPEFARATVDLTRRLQVRGVGVHDLSDYDRSGLGEAVFRLLGHGGWNVLSVALNGGRLHLYYDAVLGQLSVQPAPSAE